MTSQCSAEAKLFEGLFRKLLEDLFEAYSRTPPIVASRPYIERALRLSRAGLTASLEMLKECQSREEVSEKPAA